MSNSTSLKAADKQKILKKLVSEMKKHVKGSPPKQSLSVLDTLIFAVCLENSTYEEAQKAHSNLHETFYDLNEVRVSSVTEIEASLGDLAEADWKALRVRESLQHVFEKHYAFDLEVLKRKTQDAANKELNEVPYITPFVRDFVTQNGLGAHVLPVDRLMCELIKWLALAEENADEEQVSDAIKAGVKKSEGPQLCYLLKMVSTDPVLRPGLEQYSEIDEDVDPFQASARLAALYQNPVKRQPKKASKKVSRKKPAAKTNTRKKKSTTNNKKSTTKTVRKEVKKTTKKKTKSRKK